MSENSSLQLSKNEMVSQMAALTIAGHETTTQWVHDLENVMLEDRADDDESEDRYDSIDGPSEEEAYLQGKLLLKGRADNGSHCGYRGV